MKLFAGELLLLSQWLVQAGGRWGSVAFGVLHVGCGGVMATIIAVAGECEFEENEDSENAAEERGIVCDEVAEGGQGNLASQGKSLVLKPAHNIISDWKE